MVSNHAMRGSQNLADRRNASNANQDKLIEDNLEKPIISYCPKRKYYSTFNNLSESKLESTYNATYYNCNYIYTILIK